ncbi:MAG: hypothetical protein ACJA0U_003493 [Salibacteraceae bacterium]|jgi:hypothetical protein
MLITPINSLIGDNMLSMDSTTYYKFIIAEKEKHPLAQRLLHKTLEELKKWVYQYQLKIKVANTSSRCTSIY